MPTTASDDDPDGPAVAGEPLEFGCDDQALSPFDGRARPCPDEDSVTDPDGLLWHHAHWVAEISVEELQDAGR